MNLRIRISCKEATALVSQSLDTRLSARERLRLRSHLVICRACRRFEKQIRLLRQVLRLNTEAELMGEPEPQTLPQEARKRIEDTILSALNGQ